MRELVQQLTGGVPVRAVDVGVGRLRRGYLEVRSAASLVSAGTERGLVQFATSSLIGKARQQPHRVKDVMDKARADGISNAIDSVRARLSEPLNLGYATCGVVLNVGEGVSGFVPGDVVASNGPHAEIVTVPHTLAAKVPAALTAEEGAFATVGAIALQGVRLAEPTLGERFVVTGLGLVGLLAVQILRAHGCHVLGIDVNVDRMKLAEGFGAQTALATGDAVAVAAEFSSGRGVDGVIITASTKSSVPVHEAAQMCRQRGRIIMVGVTGLELERADFYEKELSFQVSCSYGPGRYDPSYEDAAVDYPAGFVRWTAGRNMETIIDMIATRRLDVASLVSHRYPFDQAADAYSTLMEDASALGIVLNYPTEAERPTATMRPASAEPRARATLPLSGRVAVIGVGNFATHTMLPLLRELGADVAMIVGSGVSATRAAEPFGARLTNSVDSVFADDSIASVFVLTRHDSHADLVCRAMAAGKNVFVEKPLTINTAGLEDVITILDVPDRPLLGIGFNRRFAPITRKMVELLAAMPVTRAITITVNAGAVPGGHWTQDQLVGGGRIAGEACHFIDLARHLADSPISAVHSTFLEGPAPRESAVITLQHESGSVSTINYLANGSKRYPKEQVAVFSGGRVLVNDNFRRLSVYGWPGARGARSRKQNKGHAAGIAAFLDAARTGGREPIPVEEIIEVTAATLLAAQV
jgi:predicted dehydrogenase/threonine dehydrogenase-like Zn-dependent dehydrogenase